MNQELFRSIVKDKTNIDLMEGFYYIYGSPDTIKVHKEMDKVALLVMPTDVMVLQPDVVLKGELSVLIKPYAIFVSSKTMGTELQNSSMNISASDTIYSFNMLELILEALGVETHDVVEQIRKAEEEEGRNKFIEIISRGLDENKRQLEYNCTIAKDRLEELRQQLARVSTQYELALRTKFEYNDKDFKEKVLKDLTLIKEHPYVASIEFHQRDACITINTEDIYIDEPEKDERFYLGEMRFVIPFNNTQDVKIYNMNNTRNAFWHSSHHPHVDSLGHACFGTGEGPIIEYRTKHEYYALFLTLLSFVRTCNIKDVAGASVIAWDMVDKDDKVIRSGRPYHSDGDNEDEEYEDEEEEEQEEHSNSPF